MSGINTNWEMAHFATVEERAMAVSLVLAIAVTEREQGNNGETRVKITEGKLAGQHHGGHR